MISIRIFNQNSIISSDRSLLCFDGNRKSVTITHRFVYMTFNHQIFYSHDHLQQSINICSCRSTYVRTIIFSPVIIYTKNNHLRTNRSDDDDDDIVTIIVQLS